MKKVILSLLVMLGAAPTLMFGQGKSLPLLPEGKVWNYVYHHLGNDGWQLDPYSYTVRGDSVIGSKTYKKIYRQDEEKEWLPFMLREENGALYKLYAGETDEFLLFDFKRQDIGTVTSWISSFGAKRVNWMIDAIDTVQVGDNNFRRFSCRQQYSDAPLTTIEDGQYVEHDYWVEGIGSAHEGIEASSLEIPLRLPGVYNTFASCYVDGVCVFTADDFTKNTTAIADIKAPLLRDAVYDLRGQRLSSPRKGINIIRRSDGTVRKELVK